MTVRFAASADGTLSADYVGAMLLMASGIAPIDVEDFVLEGEALGMLRRYVNAEGVSFVKFLQQHGYAVALEIADDVLDRLTDPALGGFTEESVLRTIAGGIADHHFGAYGYAL